MPLVTFWIWVSLVFMINGRALGNVLDVVFKEWRNGVLKVVAVSAKKARGMMAAFMALKRVQTPEELLSFSEDGYRFDSDLSDGRTLTFIKG